MARNHQLTTNNQKRVDEEFGVIGEGRVER